MFGVGFAPCGPHGGVVRGGVETVAAELVAQVGVVHLREAASDESHRKGGDGFARVIHRVCQVRGRERAGAAERRCQGRRVKHVPRRRLRGLRRAGRGRRFTCRAICPQRRSHSAAKPCRRRRFGASLGK